MHKDLHTALRDLPEQIDVPTPPPSAEIRTRANRRKWVRRGTGALLTAVAAALIISLPWSDLFTDGTSRIPPAGDRGHFRSPGYILSAGGAARKWELNVDIRNNETLCFDFLVEQAEPQMWCDTSMLEGRHWVTFHTFRPEGPQKLAFGAVSPDVDTLYSDVGGPEQPERSTDFEPTPEGFPRDDLRFFVIIYGPDADLELRITDANDDPLDQLTIPATPTFARFQVTFGRGKERVNGVIEIDATGSTICSSADLPWARAAQLHQDVSGNNDPVIVPLFEPPKPFRSTVCARDLDPVILLRVLDSPRDYYIDYHESDNRRRAKADLGEPTQSNIDP